VIFTSSKRGINFLRYNSSDPAGNVQTVQNKTININQLPVFTSASDNTTIIKGGSGILITTVSSDADSGQTLKLFVCNSTSANSSGCTNSEYCSNTSASTNASCSFTSETDDTTHTWYAFIYDSLNEAVATNHSGSYTTVSTPLTITIVYPENITYNTNNITASVVLVESGNWSGYCLDDCVSNVTMTRVTATYFTASMTGLSDGSHRIVFYVNDSVGNMANSSTRYFSVVTVTQDTTSPTITINSPPNGTYYTSTSVWVNITINENATSANYSLDDGSLQPMSNTSTTSWYKQLTSLSDETYHDLTCYANDTSNNQGNNSISFYVDTKAPRYSSVSANPTPANQSQSVNCSAYWTDGIGLSSGKVEENSSGSFENHTVSISGTGG
jgi:hypothetical protein